MEEDPLLSDLDTTGITESRRSRALINLALHHIDVGCADQTGEKARIVVLFVPSIALSWVWNLSIEF